MKKYLILGAIIIIAGIVINYSLGGFTPIEPGLISSNGVTLYGWHYEGSYSSETLDKLIESLRDIINTGDHEGVLTIVNYNNPDLEKRGVVQQFIGIEWLDKHPPLNNHLDSLVIQPYNGIQFNVPIKPLVMPSPEKLKSLAFEAAKKMDKDLLSFSVEQYKEQALILNYPLR